MKLASSLNVVQLRDDDSAYDLPNLFRDQPVSSCCRSPTTSCPTKFSASFPTVVGALKWRRRCRVALASKTPEPIVANAAKAGANGGLAA